MIYITGDTHGKFDYRFRNIKRCKDNMVIILGDTCINYYLDERDKLLKRELSRYNFKIFSIQGNHEESPENIDTYQELDMFGGKVFIEEEYPNLVFAKNGKIYDINGKKTLVIGGAYSVDKYYRFKNNLPYFKDEQLSKEQQTYILNKYKDTSVDVLLTHTCPQKYIPTEALIKEDNIIVDNSMKVFLDKIEETVDKLEFLYLPLKDFDTDEFVNNSYEYNKSKVLKK